MRDGHSAGNNWSPPANPQVQQWQSGDVAPDGQTPPSQSPGGSGPTLPSGSGVINPPPLRKGKASGSGTSVDTISMKQYASNMSQMLLPINEALGLLQKLKPIAAGGFNQAHNLRMSITGNTGDGTLVSGFETVLKNLIKSVNDTSDAVTKLAHDYKTVEDQNKISTTQLGKILGDVNTDIPAIANAGSALNPNPSG